MPQVLAPSAPTNLSATPGNAQVALTWTAVSGATGYKVYRSTTSGQQGNSIATPTSAGYTDTTVTNGTMYYYIVTAVNAGGESSASGQVSAAPWVELRASDGAPNDKFGVVAISSDSSTIVVGASGHKSNQGAAYVFTKSGSTWSQVQELTSSDGAANDYFGGSTTISSDGSTIVIGARGHNSNQGAAYVFTKSGSTWSQTQELTGSDGAVNDYFGGSTTISSDGSTIVIGADEHKVGSNASQGTACVYTKSGSTWSQVQELTSSDGAADDLFGISTTISSDGSTIVVGANGHKVGSNASQGAAYVFTKSGSTWSQVQELTSSDGAANDEFGISTTVSSNSSTIVIGAFGPDIYAGAAYVFTKSGSIWSQTQECDGLGSDTFSYETTISSDSSTIIVGAPLQNSIGAAFVYTKSGSTWSQVQELTSSDGAANDNFGLAAVSNTGSTIVIGAGGHQVGSNASQGTAYVFTKSGSTWTQQ